MSRTAAAALLLLLGCSSVEEAVDRGELRTMSVVDTIGVEIGPECYMFGDIRGVDTDEEGNLLVLDGTSCLVRVFSPEGEFISQFGGRGSGPGELLEPMDIAVLNDGRTAIADWEAWGVFLYGEDRSYSGLLGPMPGGSPLELTAGPGGSMVGTGLLFEMVNGESSGEYLLASWSDSITEDHRYLEGPALVEYSENGDVTVSFPNVVFDSDGLGNICAAISTDSTYQVHVYDSDGCETAVISREWNRRFPDSLSLAAEECDNTLNETGSEVQSSYASAIAGVYFHRDRIWVRSGVSSVPLFHVYDAEGNPVDSVAVSGLSDPLFELDFHFTDERIYAWNTDPVDYARVYVLTSPL